MSQLDKDSEIKFIKKFKSKVNLKYLGNLVAEDRMAVGLWLRRLGNIILQKVLEFFPFFSLFRVHPLLRYFNLGNTFPFRDHPLLFRKPFPLL